MKMKKTVLLLTLMALIFGLVAGCGGEEEDNEQQNGLQEGKSTEGITLSMLVDSHPSYPYNKDWPVWRLIEEQTGASFEVQTPSGSLDDTLNLTIASGEMPDIMFMYGKAVANKFGQQGALANILDYVEDMPNFKQWMQQYPEIVKAQLAADGNLYMFPNEGMGEGNRMIWMYREDIFSKHQLQAPATFDELYTVLKQLKELYPDSYPLSFRLGNNLLLLKLLSAHFDTNEGFYNDGGEVKFGPGENHYKSMLEYLHLFYKEGLIPPDWLSVDAKKWQDLMSTDRAFVTIDYIGRIDFFNNSLREGNPAFHLAFMAPPVGLQGGEPLNAYMHVVNSGLTVASNSKKIKEAMRTIDFYYSEKGRELLSWGKEGEHYQVVDGNKQFVTSYKDAIDQRIQTGLLTNGTYTWVDYNSSLVLASDELQTAYQEARKYDAPYRSIPDFNQQELEIITTKGAALDKYRDENVIQFIIGKQSFADWDKYVEGLHNLGLSELTALYKNAYDRLAVTGME
ncbi:extracellular solute-binding protein [Paenibacillus chungangensis]|uniref:Extracellular solute-binding protein n=1 Tax=Paenibacillus chungangensis TaxID=696535 RepID=A0ABW3HKR0_9BACL